MADCPHDMCKDKARCDIWPELPAGSEFPNPGSDISWDLLRELHDKPHPLFHDRHDLPDDLWTVQEVLCSAITVHHLLDLAGVPHRYSLDTADIGSRTLIAVLGILTLRERLDRIAGLHARETGPAGMVGDFCVECGHRWPCETERITGGADTDPDSEGEAR